MGVEKSSDQSPYLYYLLLVRGHHVLSQYLLHHMLSLGGLRHAGLCPGLLGCRDCRLFFQSYVDSSLRSQDCSQEKQPYTRKCHLAPLGVTQASYVFQVDAESSSSTTHFKTESTKAKKCGLQVVTKVAPVWTPGLRPPVPPASLSQLQID